MKARVPGICILAGHAAQRQEKVRDGPVSGSLDIVNIFGPLSFGPPTISANDYISLHT
jgi:hypothetical protein